MGVVATIGAERVEITQYAVDVASTPIDVADSSGSVGSFTLGIPHRPLLDALAYRRQKVTLTDSRRGSVTGYVDDISLDRETGLTTLRGPLTLRDMNIYNVAAKPFSGTLQGALTYYASLAGRTLEFEGVAPELLAERVNFIGWRGELWYHLKMLAAAYGIEFALQDDPAKTAPRVRPIRTRSAGYFSATAHTPSISRDPVAQAVEVNHYATRAVVNEIVYPVNGWSDDLDILSVNAGETSEVTLDLETSLSSVEQPVYAASVPMNYSGRSIYTAVGNDGLPVTPAAWAGGGGEMRLTINDDFTSITVRMTGPKGLPDADGGELKSFQIAMSSGESGNRYSALRVRGSGVHFITKTHTFRTGVPQSRTENAVGETIDNPFLTDLNRVNSAGTRSATRFSGSSLSLEGAAVHLSPEWEPADLDRFPEIAGTRVWNKETRGWFRIRSASVSRDSARYSAEDDTTLGEVDAAFDGMTLDQREAIYAGLTLAERFERGVWNG